MNGQLMNGLLYLSTECKNERPFGDDVNISGTFAVLLKSALNEIEKEKGVHFSIKKKDTDRDDLFIMGKNKTIKVCTIDGYSTVYKIRIAIERRLAIKL